MNLKTITSALVLLALCACNTGHSPLPTPEPGSLVRSGRISNQKVNSFAQDRDGHIWIATGRGLNKYTGSEFYQYFCTDDSQGLPDNQINAIHTAQDGSLWVASANGVARFTSRGCFKRYPVPEDSRNLSQILETADGKLLFLGGPNLLCHSSLSDALQPVIRDLGAFGAPAAIVSPDNRFWVLTSGGFVLNCYSTDTFSLLQSYPLPMQTYHLCMSGSDEIWLSGMGALLILDTRSGKWKELPEAIRKEKRIMEGDVDILYPMENRSLLINVIGKGFFYYNRLRETVTAQGDASFPFEIPQAEVRTLFRDRSGNLWLGTTDKGFSVSYQEQGQFAGKKALRDALEGKNVISLCPDRDGNLWIATSRDGLYCFDLEEETLRQVPVDHLIPDSEVGYIRPTKVYADRDGDLWLVFQDKVRVVHCIWDGKRLISKDVVFAAYPMSIIEDDRGAIWIGGLSNNLVRFDKRDRSRQDVSISREWTYVTDMAQKEPGKLLVSSYNLPPILLNTYTLEYSENRPTPEERDACIRRSVIIPNCLRKDSAGNIWVGTYANGLILDEAETGRKVPVNGAPCLDITAIEDDRQGMIWVSTLNGLGKYDRTTGSFIHYFEADGIGGDQFNDRASCILPDGTLIFGGTHGVTCFNPLDAPAKRTVPLVFESLSIHGQLVVPSADGPISKVMTEKPEVTIRADQNGFDISFAALDYSEFEQIRYAYKLEGFDKDWVKIDMRNTAHFANLPAGRYSLKVRIANGSHYITETEESLPIRVLPPWQRSWWAWILWALAGALLLGILYTFIMHVQRVRKEAARRIWQVRREREKAEEAQQAEKELNKIQMNYFSNVAHEFRTPLTMIAGPAQQLSESEGVKGQDRKLVDIIRRNTTWMLSLVNQLLDFNRIGNSKLQLKVAKMDIVGPLQDTASLFRFNAQSKGIELTTYGLEEPFTMWVDADKVQKVVMNLLSNALKFTPSGGKVSLAFDVIPRAEAATQFPLTASDKDGQYACIRVSDSGPGIPEDQMEKIFERFYQSEAGRQVTGSGIGLFYARALCGLHHGYIKAGNRPEGGAVFSLVLPVTAASYTEDERTVETPLLPTRELAENIGPETPEEDGSKRHIVVVDDDIDIANYLKVILKPQYKVSLYFDAESALKGMEEDVPDLVISDVVMPGMDGYELCARIKGDLQLSHIPVVLVTAKVAVESQVQGLDKGADAYVTKPFQPAYLLALVKSLLENRDKLRSQLASATNTEDISPEALSPRDAAFMKELYELMEKELANADLDIVRMTEMMKISRTKFYYKVKGLTGENPSVFFKRYKLNRAADLLKEGKYNMSEIAWMTGFNTLSHFSTSFKKQFGVPPSEYVG